MDTCAAATCETGYRIQDGDPDLRTLIGEEYGATYALISNTGSDTQNNAATYGLTSADKNVFAIDYGTHGVLRGSGRCSTRAGAANTWPNNYASYNVIAENFVSTLPDEAGQDGAVHCYCHLDAYTPVGGSMQTLNSPWSFRITKADATTCASDCAGQCAHILWNIETNRLAYRFAMFDSLNIYDSCVVDSYTITYANGGGTGDSQTQTVTYNATFTTMAANTFTKANATFAGWSASAGSYPAAGTEYTYTQTADITLTATWTCNAGYYDNNGTCTAVDAGYYSAAGDNAQHACENSKPSNSTWTANAATATCPWGCDAEYYSADSATCTAVGAGYYSAAGSNTRTACTNKPSNSTYTGSAATDACPWTCVAGYAQGNDSCTACTGATYNDTPGAATCTACPDGYTYNTTSGKTAASQCQISCAAGTFVGSILPNAYTELEYIETTGTQYIDTGVLINTKTSRYETKINPTDASITNAVFGTRNLSNQATTQSANIFLIDGRWRLDWAAGTVDYSSAVQSDTDYTISITGGRAVINETVYSHQYETRTNVNYPFYIGNINNAGSVYTAHPGFSGKTYYSKLYNNDVLVFDGIPARRNSDNVIGMYDTVSGQFFTNAGTGMFTAGPDASACIDAGVGYYAPASVVNYGSTGTRTACSNTIPTHSSYSGSATTNNCPWACDANYTEYANNCHALCSYNPIMHIGNMSFPIFADRVGVTNPSMNFMDSNGTICHMYFEPDDATPSSGLKVLYNDTVYHSIDPR